MSLQEALWALEEAPEELPPQPFAVSVPEWLWAAVQHINPGRVSPLAKLEPCRHCLQPILRAQDGNVGLISEVRVAPRLLTAQWELEELLAGRTTAELWVSQGPRPPMVYTRDQWRIKDSPGTTRRLVVPTHHCGVFSGVELPWEMIYANVYALTRSHAMESDPAPF